MMKEDRPILLVSFYVYRFANVFILGRAKSSMVLNMESKVDVV